MGNFLFLIHTEREDQLFDKIKENLDYRFSDMKQYRQKKLEIPTKVFKHRQKCWNDYHREGIDFIMRKYGTVSLKTKVKNKLLKVLWEGYSKVTVALVMLTTPKGGRHNELEAA